jgi:two-component system cell cycle response regulator DivK
MKIFICEQDPCRAKLIQDILGVYNYKIVTVSKYNEFFKEAYNQKPSIIIIHDTFAENAGVDMMGRLRKDPLTAKIPVIYISNGSGSENKVKPTGYDTLTQVVQEPFKIKNFRHYIDRWTTFRSLYVKH